MIQPDFCGADHQDMEILMTAVGGVLGAGSRVYGRVLRRRCARQEKRYVRHDRRLEHVAERF
jgi:hypothetical protein